MDGADLRAVGQGVGVGGEDLLVEGVDDVLDDKVGADGVDEVLLVHVDVVTPVIGPPAHHLNHMQPHI